MYLLVSPTGAKSWRYDYRLHGRRETLTIGTYPEAKLAEARERHMEARKRVARGESPSKQKRIEKLAAVEVAAGTFKALADKWYADKAPHRSRSWREATRRWLDKELDRHGNVVLTGLADAIVRHFRDSSPVVVGLDPVISFGAGERIVNDNEHSLILAARSGD